MKKETEVKFALEFPQGQVIFMTDEYNQRDVGGIYFRPNGSDDAFMVWGDRKELFGKHAVNVSRDPDFSAPAYSVVYEFNRASGALSDARLVSEGQTIEGTMAGEKALRALKDKVAKGEIKFHSRNESEPNKIYNVARFTDGRMLVQLFNKAELYIGTPGNFEKVDAQHTLQGGGSRYYKMPDGGQIALPYGYGGPGRDDVPTYRGETLTYDNSIKQGTDPAKIGLYIKPVLEPLNPFSPQLQKKKSTGPGQSFPL